MSELEKRPPKPRKVKIMPKTPEAAETVNGPENILHMNELDVLTDSGNRENFIADTLWQVRNSFSAENGAGLHSEYKTAKGIIEEMRVKALNAVGSEGPGEVSAEEMLLSVYNTLLLQALKERGKGTDAFSDKRDASWFLANYRLCGILSKLTEKPLERTLYDLSDIAFFLANELDMEN